MIHLLSSALLLCYLLLTLFFFFFPSTYLSSFSKFVLFNLICRRMLMNLVDTDSKELISAWLLIVSAVAPTTTRNYDVDVLCDRPIHKKIIFKNPWDVNRRFTLTSSDSMVMRPRCVSTWRLFIRIFNNLHCLFCFILRIKLSIITLGDFSFNLNLLFIFIIFSNIPTFWLVIIP